MVSVCDQERVPESDVDQKSLEARETVTIQVNLEAFNILVI